MTNDLVTITTFENGPEAHAARLRLESEGIRAAVNDEVVVNWLWYVGTALGGVKLQVAAADAERARAILDSGNFAEGSSTPGWICPECDSEVDAGFEVCWSCGAAFEDVKDHAVVRKPAETTRTADLDEPSDDFASNDESTSSRSAALDLRSEERTWWCIACNRPVELSQPMCPNCGATKEGGANPYLASRQSAYAVEREPPSEQVEAEVAEMEATINRAWKAAVIGLFLCPLVLHVYSLILLLSASRTGMPLSGPTAWKFYSAFIIDMLVGLFFGYFFYSNFG